MGNGQSAVEDRKSARIAKPKGLPTGINSGGSSPASKYDNPSPLSIGIPYSQYNDSESVFGSPTRQEAEVNQELRQHIRSQLLSPEEHDSTNETGGEKVDVLAVSLARSLSRSGSRRANVPTPKVSASKLKSNTSQLSLASERTVDLETAVALLHELRKTASPEDLVALRKMSSTGCAEHTLTIRQTERFSLLDLMTHYHPQQMVWKRSWAHLQQASFVESLWLGLGLLLGMQERNLSQT
jgi:hypothetical protein